MCSVLGCDSWRHSTQRFGLPEDPEKRLEWVQFLFEVNGQRLKESSWTDITICSKHFTDDCFVNLTVSGTVQLKSGAVPSLCVKTEPEEPVESPQHGEYAETIEMSSQCDQLKEQESPISCMEKCPTSTDAPEMPAPSDIYNSPTSNYGEKIRNIENFDMLQEKAALLQMKGKYVVNESRLLQLFSWKCPFCSSKVKMEKITHGVFIILNQWCLQCDYRKQWKNQVNASVPNTTRATEVTLEMVSTYNSHSSMSSTPGIVTVTDEDSDPLEESDDENYMDSDEDWVPSEELLLADELYNKSDDEGTSEDDDDLFLPLEHRQLCTECGRFFNKRNPHTCEHKIKPYSCNTCGKRCVTETALNSHSRIHDERYEHRCKYCNVAFKTKVDKLTHEQIHQTQENPYKCPDCSETFATNKKRRSHLKLHRGPVQLKCHICGMEFNRSHALQRHISVHTGAKPYTCSVCQRGFSQTNHLKSHMRLHTGERPYKCQHCHKCFNHNVSLKSHIQRYHTSSSGQKMGRMDKKECNNGGAQGYGMERGVDSGLDVTEDMVQTEKIHTPKTKKKSTGRPKGRPKRNVAGKDQSLNFKNAKVKAQNLKRTHASDEESEQLTENDVSCDSVEEEQERTMSTQRSRRTKNSDSDSDFDPTEMKKKRCDNKNISKGLGKQRGRPRRNQTVKDTELKKLT